MGKIDIEVAIEPHQLEWLQDAVRDYKLPDLGKAMRCLIVYIQTEADNANTFGKVRRHLKKNIACYIMFQVIKRNFQGIPLKR